jgi:hypothetical protein
MSFRIWTALGLTLALAACSNDNNNGKEPVDDGGSGKQDAGSPDPEDDAGSPEEDAAVPSKLSRPALERPPTGGLPDSLRPPR